MRMFCLFFVFGISLLILTSCGKRPNMVEAPAPPQGMTGQYPAPESPPPTGQAR